MVLIAVTCPYCQSDCIAKRGKTETGKPRYRCQNTDCPHQSFLLNPSYKGRLPEIKEQVIDMHSTAMASAIPHVSWALAPTP